MGKAAGAGSVAGVFTGNAGFLRLGLLADFFGGFMASTESGSLSLKAGGASLPKHDEKRLSSAN